MIAKRIYLKPGVRVRCRYYNRPEGKFYGEWMTGEIVARKDPSASDKRISWPRDPESKWIVKLDSGVTLVFWRKEIEAIK